MGPFDGAVVLVTGGASGMGASHVAAFVEEGRVQEEDRNPHLVAGMLAGPVLARR